MKAKFTVSWPEIYPLLAYIGICLIWGSGYPVNKVGMTGFPPFGFIGLRLTIAGCLLLTYSVWAGLPVALGVSGFKTVFVAGLLLFAGGNGLGMLGLKTVSSGPASLIVTTAPVLMALMEMWLPGSVRMNWSGWAGLFIGFGGVALLGAAGKQVQAFDTGGMMWVAAGALCWAAGSVYNSRVQSQIPLLVRSGWQMLIGGLVLTIWGSVAGDLSRIRLTVASSSAFVYMLLADCIIANSLYLYLLQTWPVAKVGSYAYLTPFIAGFLGVIFLDEPFNIQIIGSGILIVIGVILVQKSRLPKRRQEG